MAQPVLTITAKLNKIREAYLKQLPAQLAGIRAALDSFTVDPAARDLSPGVVMIHAYVARALEMGIPRLDFLRGDESYKYEWGARDEPIQRLLVRRRDPR